MAVACGRFDPRVDPRNSVRLRTAYTTHARIDPRSFVRTPIQSRNESLSRTLDICGLQCSRRLTTTMSSAIGHASFPVTLFASVVARLAASAGYAGSKWSCRTEGVSAGSPAICAESPLEEPRHEHHQRLAPTPERTGVLNRVKVALATLAANATLTRFPRAHRMAIIGASRERRIAWESRSGGGRNVRSHTAVRGLR